MTLSRFDGMIPLPLIRLTVNFRWSTKYLMVLFLLKSWNFQKNRKRQTRCARVHWSTRRQPKWSALNRLARDQDVRCVGSWLIISLRMHNSTYNRVPARFVKSLISHFNFLATSKLHKIHCLDIRHWRWIAENETIPWFEWNSKKFFFVHRFGVMIDWVEYRLIVVILDIVFRGHIGWNKIWNN